jgi:ribosomal protein L21E
MVGIGYDAATNSIYIHDTWDNILHSMTWGGSYADMDLYAVTVIHLAPPDEYGLTISSTAGGNVTTPGEGIFNYDEGTVVDLVATPDVGYRFDEWTGEVGTIADVDAASTNVTMNGDYSITANFVKIYELTISSTAGGNVTTPGEGIFSYDEGTVVDLVATPDGGYHFDEWTGEVGTIADVDAASTNVTMNGDYSITANFVKVYDLTTSSTSGGSVTNPGEGTYTYDEGAVVDLVATSGTGYRFDKWTGDVGTVADVNAASTNVTMNGDYSITANFVPVYDLTISSTVGGSVTNPGEGTYTYDEGAVVDLVATSGTGYRFDKWIGDVGTVADVNAASTNITMNGDYSITANFEEAPPSSVGCFIATAAYGTAMAEEVQILREFRDKYLLTNPIGEGLVNFYYKVSPPIAEFMTEHSSMKLIVRAGLVPAVLMSSIAVNTTLADKIAIVGLLALVSATVAIWLTKRRSRGSDYI